MDIENLKIFIASYQTQNFAAVAKELNVAPSSISRCVAALEKELKVRLFQRSTRKVIPTQAGEHFYQRILPLIEEFDRLEQDMCEQVGQPSGKVRVTASTSYGQIVLAPLLKEFHQRYPRIHVELILSDGRLDMIAEQIDLGIRHGKLEDSSLISRKLQEVQYCLVTSANFLNSADDIAQPEDISQYPIVTFNFDSFAKHWHFSQERSNQENKQKTIAIQPSLTISSAAAIRECIKNDFGIALLADWTVANDLQSGDLVKLLPDWHISGKEKANSIWLIQPSRQFVPEKVNALKAFLLEKLAGVEV